MGTFGFIFRLGGQTSVHKILEEEWGHLGYEFENIKSIFSIHIEDSPSFLEQTKHYIYVAIFLWFSVPCTYIDIQLNQLVCIE